MLTIREISKNFLYNVGFFLVAGACTCIGMAIVGFLICVLRGE